MSKVIITAAVCGSRPSKEMNPAVPYTPREIAQAALECHRAGASIAHIHVRDPVTGVPDSRLELFADVLERIRRESDMLVNLTTSGLNIAGANQEEVTERRLEPVSLGPELCSLDVGSLNFSDVLFANPPRFGEAAARRMLEFGVKPELEVFDTGHIDQAKELIERGLVAEPAWFQLCMGVRWGIAATAENLLFMHSKLPQNAIWSVLGVGRAQLAMVTMALLMGGHVRVGFEDNLNIRKGVPARSNAEFVEHVVALAGMLHREVATVADTRDILGLSA